MPKVSESHKYRIGQRLIYNGPSGRDLEVRVTQHCVDTYDCYEAPMYMVAADGDGCDWPSLESRLRDPKDAR